MARYRLRFLLQEFDLPRGATLIGRSLDCNITIEDPLVSREHARILIDDQGCHVEDAGSRNGVRVNGVPIRDSTPLRDGDRLRIGTQDFVLCRVDPDGKGHSRTTGVLRLCSKCRLPYAREMVACPNCEATEQVDEETLSGSYDGNQTAWNVQLLVEALERALSLGRVADAERIVRRATTQVDELLATGVPVDPKGLESLALQAIAVTRASNDPSWVMWTLDAFRRAGRVPPRTVVDRLAEAAAGHTAIVRGGLETLVEQLRVPGRSIPAGDLDALARLEQMRVAFEDDVPGPGDVTGEYPRPTPS